VKVKDVEEKIVELVLNDPKNIHKAGKIRKNQTKKVTDKSKVSLNRLRFFNRFLVGIF